MHQFWSFAKALDQKWYDAKREPLKDGQKQALRSICTA